MYAVAAALILEAIMPSCRAEIVELRAGLRELMFGEGILPRALEWHPAKRRSARSPRLTR